MDVIREVLTLANAYEAELPPPPAPVQPPSGSEIAAWIDHSLFKPEATAEQIKTLCEEAHQYGFASVCINPVFVSLASGLLVNSPVMVCCVVGFPLGATLATQKAFEALSCINAGADEIDMVLSIGALKGQAYGQVLNEVQTLVQVAHNERAVVKVILETTLLTRQEKIIASLLCRAVGADFVKTSTGFGPGGATVEDVELLQRVVGPEVKVKAAGGVRTLASAQAMIKAGAARIGSSAGIQIVKEAML